CVVDLVAMPMALADLEHAVDLVRARAWAQSRRIGAQPHGPAHVRDLSLRVHEADDRLRRVAHELDRMRIAQSAHAARELDHGARQPKADAEERHPLLPSLPSRM